MIWGCQMLVSCALYSLIRCWFKGNDTRTLATYLEAKLQEALPSLDDSARPFFHEMHKLFFYVNHFMRPLYSSGLWLSKSQVRDAVRFLEGLLCSYQRCAQYAYDADHCRFKLQPKYHMAGEILHSLRLDQVEGRATINPISFATQLDEDFVGKIATLALLRTVQLRTVQRYLLLVKAHCLSG